MYLELFLPQVYCFILQEGTIGHEMTIRPVPAEIQHSLNPDGKSVHHVVFKRQSGTIEPLSDFGKIT